MRPATLDRLLAILIVAVAATGGLSLRFGSPAGAWLFVTHDVLAGVLAVAVGLKLRSSVRRAIAAGRWVRLALAVVVSAVVVGALIGGYLWVASGRLLEVGTWTVLTLHAWLGLIGVPLVIVHLLPNRWRLLRPAPQRALGGSLQVGRINRRSVLVGGGLAVAGLALFGLADVFNRVSGGERRFTGSRWLAAGGIPPATTFLGDTPPSIDSSSWRLSVKGRVARPLDLDLDGLHHLGHSETTAVLDCTSGWALETAWAGTPLDAVLSAAGVDAGARRLTIRSATGWTASLSIGDANAALLATEVAGQPLPAANGAPIRLVAPDRRGLDWVKWVREVVVE